MNKRKFIYLVPQQYTFINIVSYLTKKNLNKPKNLTTTTSFLLNESGVIIMTRPFDYHYTTQGCIRK